MGSEAREEGRAQTSMGTEMIFLFNFCRKSRPQSLTPDLANAHNTNSS